MIRVGGAVKLDIHRYELDGIESKNRLLWKMGVVTLDAGYIW